MGGEKQDFSKVAGNRCLWDVGPYGDRQRWMNGTTRISRELADPKDYVAVQSSVTIDVRWARRWQGEMNQGFKHPGDLLAATSGVLGLESDPRDWLDYTARLTPRAYQPALSAVLRRPPRA